MSMESDCMRVEIVAVGTELLLGDVVNTNAAWLGQKLAAAGLDVRRTVVVGDNVPRIAEAIRAAAVDADAVIVSGGLGPTEDDVTRDALARVAEVELFRDPDAEENIRASYAAAGRVEVPLVALRMANLPLGATPLGNAAGTAPGVRMEVGDAVVYLVPGVPVEMGEMVSSYVLPELITRAGEPAVLVSRVLHTVGLGEPAVAERLGALFARLERPDGDGRVTLAYLASRGQVRVRLTVKAATREAALERLAPVEAEARSLLGDVVYGVDGDTLDAVVHRLLAARGATVTVAESLTGGLLGGALTAMAGSSATFGGGVTAYTEDVKASVLGVPGELLALHGPVHPDVALAMAKGVRERLRGTYGLATTGVAGPEEHGGHRVGTVHLAVVGPDGSDVDSLLLHGDREGVRERAVIAALDLLRRHVIGNSART
jgi:nicotinamide-nucleotide amidase